MSNPKDYRFDTPETRQTCLYEFLENRFNKRVENITKEELRSFNSKDFGNPSINKTSVGSARTLLNWAGKSKDRKGQKVIFYLLKDAGLADKHKLAEIDFDEFTNHSVRQTCLYEFLKNRFGKEVDEITREELLSLQKMDFRNAQFKKTLVGNAVSFHSWSSKSKARCSQNVIFYILKDAGLADKHQLSNSDFKDSAGQHKGEAHIIFSPSNRKVCLYEFLKNKFDKEVKDITREELLSLGVRDFHNHKTNKTSVGSAGSLLAWAQHSEGRNGQNAIFYLLKDTGLAGTHSITEKDVIQAARARVNQNRQIVFIENKLLSPNGDSKTIDTSLQLEQKDRTAQIQSIFSTSMAENPEAPVQSASAHQQVLAHYFPNIPTLPSNSAYQKLKEAVVGECMVITSKDPLDDIYLNGLSLMGFEPIMQNQSHPQAKGCYFTSIIRKEIKTDAVPLMFDNDLYPVKAAMHVLGQYGRIATSAKSEVELYHAIGLGLEWLIKIAESGVLQPNQVEYVKVQGLDKLARVEARTMARLGLGQRYASDLNSRYNEVAQKLAPAKIKAEQKVDRAIQREKFSRIA